MFPASGVPAADAKNSLPDAQVNSLNCDELWYSTSRCQPRFDPAAANALLAEVINVIMKGEVTYDCNFLDRLQLAIRYLDQRGLMKVAATTGGGGNLYDAALDPPATRYNHGMQLVIAFHQANTGPVWLNVNGLGYKQVLKGSGNSLKSNDVLGGYPRIVVFYGDNWWMLGAGIVQSDIPILGTLPQVLTADLNTYVDWQNGSDATGDGTLGNPFQTIDGCWNKLGALYIASPIYKIRIHLVRPGDHKACSFAAYGGRVEVHGGGTLDSGTEDTKLAFKIISAQDANPGAGNPYSFSVGAVGMASLTFQGVNFVMRGYPEGTGVQMGGIAAGGGSCNFIDCGFSIEADNPGTAPIWSKDHAQVGFTGVNDIFGNNNRVAYVALGTGGHFQTLSGARSDLRFHAMTIQQQGFKASDLARFSFPGCIMTNQGATVTGVKYRVETNSVMSMYGQQPPGSTDGTAASGGVFNP
jgi:hypothetical protein